MILDAGKLSIDDLKQTDAKSVTSISIENTLEAVKAEAIAQLIENNEKIKIVLVADPALSISPGKYTNLDIVRLSGRIRHLAVLAFGSEQLSDLSPLSELEELESFQLA